MRKKFLLVIGIFVVSLFTGNIYNVKADNIKYYLGGMSAGIELVTRGASIVGVGEVVTREGAVSPSKKAGVIPGDIILSIDSFEVNDAVDVEFALKNGKEKHLAILRGEEIINLIITPALDLSGNYRLGVFIKNGINGIGTITYFSSNNRFASLGHPVFVNEKIAEVKKGTLYTCSITGYTQGEYGKPGELKGVFLKEKKLGVIDKNADNGIFGNLNKGCECLGLMEIELGEGRIGEASIYTTIDGVAPKEYSISIVKTDTRAGNLKNFVIKINDKRLIETTGGIVQGMSGSPIVQDGKLIGAITHVFTNDPLRGFGISISNMIVS